jgi:hypothetical protein
VCLLHATVWFGESGIPDTGAPLTEATAVVHRLHCTHPPMSLAIRRGDAFLERVAKLVPIDVLSLFLVPMTMLPPGSWRGWSPISVGAGLVLVPVLLYWDAARTATHAPVLQYVVRSLVFVAWCLVLSATFAAWVRLDPRIGVASALLLPLAGERAISRGNP